MTNVTIRGINEHVYNEFSAESKKQGKSVGDFTTEAMRLYLERFQSKEEHRIIGIQTLRISKKDLEEYDEKVSFTGIHHLIFEDDVDKESFEKYIGDIVGVNKAEFPKQFPKIYLYTKCRGCNEIIRRD
jgi:hypothetical protein